MHKISKIITNLDPTPHENEEAISKLFKSTTIDHDIVTEARAAGFTWSQIIETLFTFGPQFVAVLQAMIAALKTPPPDTQAVSQKFVPETSDHPKELPHHGKVHEAKGEDAKVQGKKLQVLRQADVDV